MAHRYRWLVAAIFLAFLTMHTADQFIISAVASDIREEFKVGYLEMGLVFTATILVAAVLYPVWGYLADRYSRRLLASAAAIIWGLTTLVNASARSFEQFFATRLFTGIDDAAPPGIRSLLFDYFEPSSRGRAIGLVSASGPLGAIIGSILSLSLVSAGLGWRSSYYITGSVGIATGVLMYILVRDVPRGVSEPELSGRLKQDVYKASLRDLPRLLRNRSLLLIYLQGFFGVFPWNAITYWMITYMREERGLAPDDVSLIMVLWLLAMAAGNVAAGYLSDYVYRKSPRGRALMGAIVVYFSAVLIYLTMASRDYTSFLAFGVLTAFEIPMAGPAVSAAIGDVVEPELRGSAGSFASFFESAGSALSPTVVGYMASIGGSLGEAITLISVVTWVLCGVFFTALSIVIPRDVKRLREEIGRRASQLAAA